ncbi:hypothetical protein SAMN05421690_104125 [Nitrosomonas sp. Nm51]|uniref:hypothetical protein n=1 Tax=Nitrosomonas sp. Nm51 TaxID=133720 RepID=UPI0008D0E757|nr:hypothetical protein [Nitrosomonas sp. Nm51]SER59270.1 hypothetical protein SAMN05421690_104125 [Nitrosomonas sp. Nm51]
MLIRKEQADTFLEKYKSIMAHLNGGGIPSGIKEYTALRSEIYKRIEGIDKNCKELVGEQFIESLRSAICTNFVYLKKYRNGYVLQDTESGIYYQVAALTTPLEEFLPEFCYIETAIVPFENHLLCDGLVFSRNILIGKNMAKEIRDGYWEAKRTGGLIVNSASMTKC